ncbi:unnamed protein product [Prunus armeniaca]|uniref:Uncharacterized protein n=1 Tax=Prunus armeniaca TaxID=36596 RepID=A0A6J5Y8S3_PRUAR|nr:unnamed protein product [Prunus armeniaca]
MAFEEKTLATFLRKHFGRWEFSTARNSSPAKNSRPLGIAQLGILGHLDILWPLGILHIKSDHLLDPFFQPCSLTQSPSHVAWPHISNSIPSCLFSKSRAIPAAIDYSPAARVFERCPSLVNFHHPQIVLKLDALFY